MQTQWTSASRSFLCVRLFCVCVCADFFLIYKCIFFSVIHLLQSNVMRKSARGPTPKRLTQIEIYSKNRLNRRNLRGQIRLAIGDIFFSIRCCCWEFAICYILKLIVWGQRCLFSFIFWNLSQFSEVMLPNLICMVWGVIRTLGPSIVIRASSPKFMILWLIIVITRTLFNSDFLGYSILLSSHCELYLTHANVFSEHVFESLSKHVAIHSNKC